MTASRGTRPTRREPVESHVRAGEWRHRAACRSVDPEIFFPAAVQGREFEQQVGIAKAVCVGCPVREACLTWALTALSDGVAGGLTEYERRSEQARRRRSRRGVRLPRPRTPRRPRHGSRAEVAVAGRAALAAGMSAREVAGEFLVSRRTAERWARAAHPDITDSRDRTGSAGSASGAGEGRDGGDGSPSSNAPANPRAEGPEGR